MRHYKVVQGSEEWLRLRLGKPTASEFERIITPKKWEPTKGETRRAYQVYLLTELILDTPLANVTTAAMQSGHDWEPKARAAYEMMHGVDVEQCGFCTNDEDTVGASPDGFVGDDGSLEIKSPFKPEIHVGYLLDSAAFVAEYFVQVQGQLYITGRKWSDLVSYFGGLPMLTVRVLPEPAFQEKLHNALLTFTMDLHYMIQEAIEKGWMKQRTAMDGWIERDGVMVRDSKPVGDFYFTDAEIEAILDAREGA